LVLLEGDIPILDAEIDVALETPCEIPQRFARPPSIDAVPIVMHFGVCLLKDHGPQLGLLAAALGIKRAGNCTNGNYGHNVIHENPFPSTTLEKQNTVYPNRDVVRNNQSF